MNDILVLCGWAFIVLVVITAIMIAGMYIKEWLGNLHDEWIYKHRFHKAPKAKCYCKDCEYFDKTGMCIANKRCFPDNGFCSLAYPKEHIKK